MINIYNDPHEQLAGDQLHREWTIEKNDTILESDRKKNSYIKLTTTLLKRDGVECNITTVENHHYHSSLLQNISWMYSLFRFCSQHILSTALGKDRNVVEYGTD